MDKAHPSASASSQAAIKLGVLIEHTLGGDFKIARALCHQIADGGGGQVDCRDLQLLGYINQSLLLLGIEIDGDGHHAVTRNRLHPGWQRVPGMWRGCDVEPSDGRRSG